MTSPPEVRGPFLLLEEFEQKVSGRERPLGSLEPDPSGLEPHFLLADFPRRYAAGLAAQRGAHAADRIALRAGPPLRLLVEDFDPAARVREFAAQHHWAQLPAQTGPELRLEMGVASPPDTRPPHSIKLLAAAAQLTVALIVATQVEFVAPQFQADSTRDYQQISLVAPTPDEIRELTGQPPDPNGVDTLFTGDRQDLNRDLYSPEPPAPEPGTPAPQSLMPDPEPELPTQPDVKEEAAAEDPPAEPKEDAAPDAFSPQPAIEERPVQVAKSPSPGETRQGSELARRRDPRELPPPTGASRRPQITLEEPKASMPGERGPIELGSLRIPERPDQRLRQSIEQARRQGGGRQAVGDTFGAGGMGGYLPPSKGNTASDIELLTDPNGVDFRPYLIQILNSVRRNWYAVIPESARLGMNRGQVQIQFIVARDGSVPKLVIASSSGAQSLDRAAVAGISASNPFPPLPREYAGKEVRLQFTFLYNIKKN